MTGMFGGTLAGVECKGKGGWEVGLGIERRVDGAHKEIEKVRGGAVKGKWRGQNQASRPEEGGCLVSRRSGRTQSREAHR